ncbi:hypothetical protein [Devosia sp. MC1541]|uniref:hypothetical protein n=1 Tax=Devosia sp. MC1541 TaxID=2725264 RepID=UPI00145EFBEE|nr:hypothetical protein [Devosia sp. MC1541]
MTKKPMIGVVLPRSWEKAHYGRGGKLGELDTYLTNEFPDFEINTDLYADEPNEALTVLSLASDGLTINSEVPEATLDAISDAIESYFAPSLSPSN